MLGRVHVEADDVAHLVGELGIVGELEGLDLVGLEPMRVPDALHRRMADPQMLSQAAHAPLRRVGRHLMQGRLDNAPDHRIAELGLAPATRRILEQTVETGAHVSLLPAPDRRLALARRRADRHRAVAVRRQQHDPRTPRVLLRAHPIGHHPFQPFPIPRPKPDLNALPHPPRFAHLGQQGILQSVTNH